MEADIYEIYMMGTAINPKQKMKTPKHKALKAPTIESIMKKMGLELQDAEWDE